MKLYYSKGACSLAVRIALNEMKIPCQYESVNLKTKQTETGADFYKINPKGAVPTLHLETGDILTENAVIQQYLADTSKSELLPPIGNIQRYHTLEWLNYVGTELHKGFSPFFHPTLAEQVKEDVCLPILKKKFQYVEEHLAKNNYLLGDQFTLPDCYLFVMLTWMPAAKLAITQFPALSRYFNTLKKRESVIKSLQEEGLLEKLTT
jgi:glutathione S-transferase